MKEIVSLKDVVLFLKMEIEELENSILERETDDLILGDMYEELGVERFCDAAPKKELIIKKYLLSLVIGRRKEMLEEAKLKHGEIKQDLLFH